MNRITIALALYLAYAGNLNTFASTGCGWIYQAKCAGCVTDLSNECYCEYVDLPYPPRCTCRAYFANNQLCLVGNFWQTWDPNGRELQDGPLDICSYIYRCQVVGGSQCGTPGPHNSCQEISPSIYCSWVYYEPTYGLTILEGALCK